MSLWPAWSVRKNLRYVASLAGVAADRADSAAARVGLASESRTTLRRLSLGNRQRVLLASAMLTGEKLLLLDEPMNGLDPDARQQTRDLIVELAAQGRTIVLSSHDLHEVETLCNHLLVLDDGRLIHAGPTAAFLGTAQMVLLELAVLDDFERAVAALAHAGIRYRRDPIGWPTVFAHDAAAAGRVLADNGIAVRGISERQATLEERFHDRA